MQKNSFDGFHLIWVLLLLSLSETKFTESVAFRGEGYLELSKELLPHIHAAEQEIIELEISTTASHGILFWHGQPPTEVAPMDDYLSVALNDGKVEFRWELGSGPSNLVSEERVNNGSRQKVYVNIYIEKGYNNLFQAFQVCLIDMMFPTTDCSETSRIRWKHRNQ